MGRPERLDAHEKPPVAVREVYKRYQKLPSKDLDKDSEVVDFRRGLSSTQQIDIRIIATQSKDHLAETFATFINGASRSADTLAADSFPTDALIYEHRQLPGWTGNGSVWPYSWLMVLRPAYAAVPTPCGDPGLPSKLFVAPRSF